MEDAILSRTIPQGAGTRLDADTFRNKLPDYFAKAGGSVGISFNALNILFPVTTDPSAPTTGGIVYCKVVGGKTKLCVRFPTGAIQTISTEP